MSANPSSAAPVAGGEDSSGCKLCSKKTVKIALVISAVAAVAVPIVCKLLCKEEEEEEEKEVGYSGSAMLDKLVSWVKEFKGSNNEEEAKEVAKYERVTSVPEFAKAQSL